VNYLGIQKKHLSVLFSYAITAAEYNPIAIIIAAMASNISNSIFCIIYPTSIHQAYAPCYFLSNRVVVTSRYYLIYDGYYKRHDLTNSKGGSELYDTLASTVIDSWIID